MSRPKLSRQMPDFKTPALGVSLRWGLIGIQIGRHNYIVRWGA